MINFLWKAIAQLTDPSLRRVIYLSIFTSLIILGILAAGIWFLVSLISIESIPYLTSIRDWMGDWFDWLSSSFYLSFVGVITFLLFPSVISLVLGIFFDDIVVSVESRHYPNLPYRRHHSFRDITTYTIGFTCVILMVNMAAIPLYLILIFFPPMNLILFYLINGYLAGREYFDLVGLLRKKPKDLAALRKYHRSRIQIAGMLIVLLMTIPFVNLITPVIATAFMVHFYHSLQKNGQTTH